MTRLIDAEFFKMRKRLMTWVCALVLVGLILLLYWVLWDASGEATKRLGNSRFFQEDLRRVLYLQYSVPFSLQVVGFFGAVLAVVFAAGSAGRRVGWGSRRPVSSLAP